MLFFRFVARSIFFLFTAETFIAFCFAFAFVTPVFAFIFALACMTFMASMVATTTIQNSTNEFADGWTLIAHLWYLLFLGYVTLANIVQIILCVVGYVLGLQP